MGVLWVRVTLGRLFRNMLDPDEGKHVRVKRRHGRTLEACLASLFMRVDYPNNIGGDNAPRLLELHTLVVYHVTCSVLMKVQLKQSLPANTKKTDIEEAILMHNLKPDFIRNVRVIRIVN